MATGYINEQNDLIARGLVRGVSHVNKFGFNSATSSSFETVWDNSNTYTYLTSAGTATVTAADSDDNGGTVEIQGLDENYNLQIVTATIGGSATTEQFIRVFRVRLTNANTGDVNVDDISVTINSTNVAKILAEKGQTLMAVYTIPNGKQGLLKKFQGSMSKNQDAVFKILTKNGSENVFNTKGQFGTFGNVVTYDYPIPLVFNEKTDIEIRVKTGSAAEAGAIFDLLILDLPRLSAIQD